MERRVQQRAVQALVIVLNNELPVGLHFVNDPPVQTQIAHTPWREFLWQFRELLFQRLRVPAQMQEDVAIPDAGAYRVQRIVLASEAWLVHVRRAEEPAIEIVGPAMIGALDASREIPLARRADARAAVPADVVERPQDDRAIAHDDDAFAGKFAQEIIARVGDALGPAGAEPAMEVEAPHLPAKNCRVGVVTRRKGLRTVAGHGSSSRPRRIAPPSAPPGRPPAGSPRGLRASCASCLPFASRGACACAKCRRRSIWRARSSA